MVKKEADEVQEEAQPEAPLWVEPEDEKESDGEVQGIAPGEGGGLAP